MELTKEAIKLPEHVVLDEDYQSRFLQMDFGICIDNEGNYIPQLIELQDFHHFTSFKTYCFKPMKKSYDLPHRFSAHVDGLSRKEYKQMLLDEIIGDTDPKQVVLLEIEPEKQVIYIDFLCAEKMLGLKVLCVSKMKKDGTRLFYLDEDGYEITIKKIYNRVIFDELDKRSDLKREFYFKDKVDIEWVGHPNWFL